MKRPGQRSVAREGLVKFAGARQSFGVELNKGVERGAILVVGGNAIEIALRERDAIERPGPEGIMYLADRGFFQREGYSLVLPSCADSALQWNMAGSARHSPGPLSYDAAALLCSRQLNMARKRSIDNRTTSAGRRSATASRMPAAVAFGLPRRNMTMANRKIRPSVGCGENSVPSTVVGEYGFRKLGGHLGNVG